MGNWAVLGVTLMMSAAAEQTRFLMLDSGVIEETDGARLALGQVVKDPRNPLFREDKPWEPRYDNLYANVLYDGDDGLYKCWYSPFIRDGMVAETPREQYATVRYRVKDRTMGICYATSKDGIVWDKPLFDDCPFDGEPSNVVFVSPHGAGVFKDLREPDQDRRYKAFFKDETMCVAFSADGIHWADPTPCTDIDAAGDTHNNAVWAPELGKYVGITRLWDKVRQVGRTESVDFLKWTKAEMVLEGIEPHLQTYAMPVFRYGGVYLGLPVIFNTETDRTHTELSWSPDTVTWRRVCPGTPFIPNAETEGAYDWGCVYPAAYPVFLDHEIRLYYGGSNGPHTNWRDGFFCLATLRPDGFAGYEPETTDAAARVTTTAIAVSGGTLRISADVRDNGSVRVTATTPDGKRLAQSEAIRETVTDGAVTWADGWDLSSVHGNTVKLTFTLENAKLYSFAW